jgi:alcohol dehydrogenase, propanol-preferring
VTPDGPRPLLPLPPEKPVNAMVLSRPGEPLVLASVRVPTPAAGQLLLKVHACGVCRTDLHVVDGELPHPRLPRVPGHEIVGTVVLLGEGTEGFAPGDRVGVPWLGWTCGRCEFCLAGAENLCDEARFTGYDLDGGYAEYAVADSRFCFPLPPDYSDAEVAPLLCAGMIGYRCLRAAGDVGRIGIYGFGAAAHIMTQIAGYEGREIFAFTRPGDEDAQRFARQMGALWAADSTVTPPAPLDAAIILAPVGALVPQALRAVRKGGRVVCGGIHMSDIPSFPYEILWGEREVRSVANLTRRDGTEFLALASRFRIRTEVRTFPLSEANLALDALRGGRLQGAAVLNCEGG